MLEILETKYCRNRSLLTEEVSNSTGWFLLRAVFIVLKRICGLPRLRRTISEKYFVFYDLTVFCYLSHNSFKMSNDTCNLSFFHLRSALLHSRLIEREMSVSHGSFLAFRRSVFKGATQSRMLVQVE